MIYNYGSFDIGGSMKKLLILFLFFVASVNGLVAASGDDYLDSDGFGFGIGANVGFKSPLLAAGSDGKFVYNEVFEAKLKAISIDDFIFGIPLRFDWSWSQRNGFGLSVKLDFDSYYMVTGNYSQLTESLKQKIMELAKKAKPSTDYDLESGLRSDLTPMFALKYKLFQFSVGVGLTIDLNASKMAKGLSSLVSGDKTKIDESLVRIGLDPANYGAVTDAASLKSALSPIQLIEYYGMHLDLHYKMSADFLLGKHVLIGADFLMRFCSEFAKWDTSADFQTNTKAVFDPSKFEGTIGFHFIWMI